MMISVTKELNKFIHHWDQYNILWNDDISTKKDVNLINLLDLGISLRQHCELEAELKVEPDNRTFGSCFTINIGRLYYYVRRFIII